MRTSHAARFDPRTLSGDTAETFLANCIGRELYRPRTVSAANCIGPESTPRRAFPLSDNLREHLSFCGSYRRQSVNPIWANAATV
ncbi:hypothetical protein [Novipirellula galeiformis]|uniref:hypothetical protein n=1 Tax=Novipirellula galeiformis TaxID=2528004 RepID=UPI0011B555EB|nr:hypothetical protein [Novipirellula galeiformis]